jgi:Tetracyclin repressor-like, C-terminal domain
MRTGLRSQAEQTSRWGVTSYLLMDWPKIGALPPLIPAQDRRQLNQDSVTSDIDGAKIVQQMGIRFNEAIVRMLKSSREPVATDPQLVASILQGMMFGVHRRMLESGAPEKESDALRRELIVVACAYLDACSARVSV